MTTTTGCRASSTMSSVRMTGATPGSSSATIGRATGVAAFRRAPPAAPAVEPTLTRRVSSLSTSLIAARRREARVSGTSIRSAAVSRARQSRCRPGMGARRTARATPPSCRSRQARSGSQYAQASGCERDGSEPHSRPHPTAGARTPRQRRHQGVSRSMGSCDPAALAAITDPCQNAWVVERHFNFGAPEREGYGNLTAS